MAQNKNIVLHYDITDAGDVINTRTGCAVSTQVTKRGYIQVRLQTGKGDSRGRKVFSVHRLVAKAFIPNPNGLPEVNHKNGVKSDNRVNNLEWVSRRENIDHAIQHKLYRSPKAGTGKFNELHDRSRPINQLHKDGSFVRRYPSIHEAGRKGFHPGNICSVLAGRYKTTGGFKWEYADVYK